jgi:hypothetical protein
MEVKERGSLGLRVSEQTLGCMGMSTTYGPSNDRESLSTLDRAVGLGVTFFDAAEVYGPFRNEELLGRALSGRRGEPVLATKVGFAFTEDGRLKMINGTPIVDGRAEHVTRAVEVGRYDAFGRTTSTWSTCAASTPPYRSRPRWEDYTGWRRRARSVPARAGLDRRPGRRSNPGHPVDPVPGVQRRGRKYRADPG